MTPVKRGTIGLRVSSSIILGVLASSLIVNCKSPADDDTYLNEDGISFLVQDTEGNALDSVGIHFILDFGFGGSSNSRRANPRYALEVSVVDLVSFTATAELDQIRLDWATSGETNHLGFEIERSAEGGEYSVISSGTNDNYLVEYDSTTGRHDYLHLDYAITGGREYSYLLIDVDSSGTSTENGPVTVTSLISALLPNEFRLTQNYPNPFNPSTTIQFSVPEIESVLLQIRKWWDGELVRTLVDATMAPGYHSVQWDGRDNAGNHVTNNMYTYHMTTGNFSDNKNMCLLMVDPDKIRGLNAIPLVTADNNGLAYLDYSQIPLGESVVRIDENGIELGIFTVSDSVDFLFLRQGYQAYILGIAIDTTIGFSHTITLEPN